LSISPTFYEQHFRVLRAAFMGLQFGFVIFCKEEICAKAAHKMLVLFRVFAHQNMLTDVFVTFCQKDICTKAGPFLKCW